MARKHDVVWRAFENIVDRLHTFRLRYDQTALQEFFINVQGVCRDLNQLIDQSLLVKQQLYVLTKTYELETMFINATKHLFLALINEKQSTIDYTFLNHLFALIIPILRNIAELRNCYLYTEILPLDKTNAIEEPSTLAHQADKICWVGANTLHQFKQLSQHLEIGLVKLDQAQEEDVCQANNEKESSIKANIMKSISAIEFFIFSAHSPENKKGAGLNERFAVIIQALETQLTLASVKALSNQEEAISAQRKQALTVLFEQSLKIYLDLYEFRNTLVYEEISPLMQMVATETQEAIQTAKTQLQTEHIKHHVFRLSQEERASKIEQLTTAPATKEENEIAALQRRRVEKNLNFDSKKLSQPSSKRAATPLQTTAKTKHHGNWCRLKQAAIHSWNLFAHTKPLVKTQTVNAEVIFKKYTIK